MIANVIETVSRFKRAFHKDNLTLNNKMGVYDLSKYTESVVLTFSSNSLEASYQKWYNYVSNKYDDQMVYILNTCLCVLYIHNDLKEMKSKYGDENVTEKNLSLILLSCCPSVLLIPLAFKNFYSKRTYEDFRETILSMVRIFFTCVTLFSPSQLENTNTIRSLVKYSTSYSLSILFVNRVRLERHILLQLFSIIVRTYSNWYETAFYYRLMLRVCIDVMMSSGILFLLETKTRCTFLQEYINGKYNIEASSCESDEEQDDTNSTAISEKIDDFKNVLDEEKEEAEAEAETLDMFINMNKRSFRDKISENSLPCTFDIQKLIETNYDAKAQVINLPIPKHLSWNHEVYALNRVCVRTA